MSLGKKAELPRRFLDRKRSSWLWARLGPGRLTHALLRPSLLVYLSGLSIIVLVPALCFSAFLIFQFSKQQEELARAQVDDMAEIVSNAFDREAVGLLATARVLATSGSVETKNFDFFRQRSLRALAGTGIVADLLDRDGSVIVSTSSEPFEPLEQSRERDVIASALDSGTAGVSGVAFDTRMDRPVFLVAVPTSYQPDPAYVVILTKPLQTLDNVIDMKRLRGVRSIVVGDGDGDAIFVAGATETNGFVTRRATQDMGTDGARAGEPGVELIEATTVSPLTGWRTTVAASNQVIEQPVMRSWYTLIAVGLVLTVFSGALGILMGQRLTLPIRALSKQAQAIGRGERAATVRTDIAEIGEVSKVLNRASRDRMEAEEQTRLLMREMTHRAKNQYALVAAIARRAARESANTQELLETLSEALSSLARSADLLSSGGWENVELATLVDNQLAAFGVQSDRIRHQGPRLRVNASVAQTIGLALHELGTNAAKYGALSNEDGVVSIEWTYGDAFRMEWRESGGPPVRQPTRAGFGSLVTQKMTARGLGGTARMSFAESGVVWSLEAPAESAEPVLTDLH